MTIATPSAKSHERVTGRWDRDLHQSLSKLKTPREWMLYYVKLASGTPVPWLMCAYALMAFISRAGIELAAWAAGALTLIYIAADSLSALKEFRFFRIGGDFFLLGYLVIGIIAAAGDTDDSLSTLGGLRWVVLLYAITFCWSSFPA